MLQKILIRQLRELDALNVTHKGLYCLGYGLCVGKTKLKNPRYSRGNDLDSLVHFKQIIPQQP